MFLLVPEQVVAVVREEDGSEGEIVVDVLSVATVVPFFAVALLHQTPFFPPNEDRCLRLIVDNGRNVLAAAIADNTLTGEEQQDMISYDL